MIVAERALQANEGTEVKLLPNPVYAWKNNVIKIHLTDYKVYGSLAEVT